MAYDGVAVCFEPYDCPEIQKGVFYHQIVRESKDYEGYELTKSICPRLLSSFQPQSMSIFHEPIFYLFK